MHYLLKPLLRAMRKMDDRELIACIVLGLLMFIAGVLDMSM
jgi:Kef-type K+ transport system membrane component KefB